jgi:hypothetical protein
MDPPGRRLNYPIGTNIATYFDEGVFHGQVVRYDLFHGIYLILYEDGDKEEMDLRDLEKHVLDEHSHSISSPDSKLERSSGSAKRKRESEPSIQTEAEEARDRDVVTLSSTRNDESGDGELTAGIVSMLTMHRMKSLAMSWMKKTCLPALTLSFGTWIDLNRARITTSVNKTVVVGAPILEGN